MTLFGLIMYFIFFGVPLIWLGYEWYKRGLEPVTEKGNATAQGYSSGDKWTSILPDRHHFEAKTLGWTLGAMLLFELLCFFLYQIGFLAPGEIFLLAGYPAFWQWIYLIPASYLLRYRIGKRKLSYSLLLSGVFWFWLNVITHLILSLTT